MTILTTIRAMVDAAYQAYENPEAVFDRLRTFIDDQANTLTVEVNGLEQRGIGLDKGLYMQSFSLSDLTLFRDAYKKIDATLEKVVKTGAISEEEFNSIGLEPIGITLTPMRIRYTPIIDLMDPSTYYNIKYPDHRHLSFRASSDYAGQPQWDDVRWEEMTDEQKIWLCTREDPTTISDRSVTFLRDIATNTYFPVIYQYRTRYEVELWREIPRSSEDDNEPVIVISNSYQYPSQAAVRVNEQLKVAKILDSAYQVFPSSNTAYHRIRDGIGSVFYEGTPYFGKNLFCFCKLLRGKFGKKHSTTLDGKLSTRFRSDTDTSIAKRLIDFIIKEANEYTHSNITDIPQVNNVDFSRTLEQAAMLYAAKFAVLKIMCGQAARLIYK